MGRQRWYTLVTQFWSGDLCICPCYCVQLKNDVFTLSLPSPFYQSNNLSLTNVVTYPHCFRTAYKNLCSLPVLAVASDSKTQTHTTRDYIMRPILQYFFRAFLHVFASIVFFLHQNDAKRGEMAKSLFWSAGKHLFISQNIKL